MKMARTVIISYVLLTAAIIVGDASKSLVGPVVTKAADCCNPCPPLCPWPPGSGQ